jgi:hypothetical protein
MAFRMGISTAPPIGVFMMFFIFGGWACITIAILCVMEGKANISQTIPEEYLVLPGSTLGSTWYYQVLPTFLKIFLGGSTRY